jgi:hypothetical protein
MGVVPGVFLRPMEPSVKRTIERVTGRSYAATSRPQHVVALGAKPASVPAAPLPTAARDSRIASPEPEPTAASRRPRSASSE